MFYFELFLVFLYFKITRVHKKEEVHNFSYKIFDLIVALDALYLFTYGFLLVGIIPTMVSAFLFFILAALIITAIQIGIFFDGKPLFGISRTYVLLLVLPIAISFGLLAL